MKKPKKRIFGISGGLIFILISTFIVTGTALSAEKKWVGGVSDWNSAGNWDPNGVPIRGDSVLINQTGATVSYNNPLNPTLRSLQIDDPSGTNPHPTLFQDGLTLTTEKTEIGFDLGRSFYSQIGGTHRILIGSLYNNNVADNKGNLHLGVGPNSFGSYDLVDAVLSVAGHEKVGIAGEGQMNQMTNNLNRPGPKLQCSPPNNPPPVTPPPNGPIHTVGKNLYVGMKSHKDNNGIEIPSQVNIWAGKLTVGGSIRVGIEGVGYFQHTDSNVTIKGIETEDPLVNALQPSNGGGFSNLIRKQAATPSLECHETSKLPGLIVGVKNYGTYALTGGTLNVNYSEVIGWGEMGDGSS